MLLEAGADPTDDRDGLHGNEVLYHACEFRDPTCAMLVIDAGARQDFVDYDLGRALNFPNPVLLEAGARVDGNPDTEEIPKEPYAEIVRILLAAGTSVPERIGENGARTTMLIAELGVDPPS